MLAIQIRKEGFIYDRKKSLQFLSSLFSLQTGKPVAIAVPQDYQIKSDIAVRFKDGKVTTSTKESVGKELMPYFTTGNSENEQTAPLKVENGYATISLPDAGYGFSHLPYGYLNSQRKENLLIPRPGNLSILLL